MKANIGFVIVAAAASMILGFNAAAQNQQQKPPDFEQIAEDQADKFCEQLDLNDYQLFYVDSTLKHDLLTWNEEYQKLVMSKVANSTMYQDLWDKWQQATYDSFRRILSDEQWELYLKNGAGKEQRARDKRREKAEKALEK